MGIEIKHLPLDKCQMTSAYGMRDLTVNGVSRWWHSGIDLRASEGTQIYAVDDGTVKVIGHNPTGYGEYIVVDHGTYGTLYAHLSKFEVVNGQTVNAGDKIALSGNTGASTGPHLHFEIRECKYANFWVRNKDDNIYMYTVDPLPYITARINADNQPAEMQMDRLTAFEQIQKKAGLSDSTMMYLNSYVWRDDLAIKLARALK